MENDEPVKCLCGRKPKLFFERFNSEWNLNCPVMCDGSVAVASDTSAAAIAAWNERNKVEQ